MNSKSEFINCDYYFSDMSIKFLFLMQNFSFLLFAFCRVNVVQWSEDLYEKQLIERTHDACKGLVDIVIDFGTTSRSLHRSLQCLNEGGVVLISEETAEKLLPKFHRRAAERKQHIEPVPVGTIQQLKDLVNLVANKEVSFVQLLIDFPVLMNSCKYFRLNHHRIPFFLLKRQPKLFTNLCIRKFLDVQSFSSTISNKQINSSA